MIRLGAEHDTVRLHEVVDGRAFLEELGVADDVKRKAGVAADGLGDLRRRPDGHRGLRDDDGLARHAAADRLGDVEHVPQVGGAVFVRRRADGDEHDFGARDRGRPRRW